MESFVWFVWLVWLVRFSYIHSRIHILNAIDGCRNNNWFWFQFTFCNITGVRISRLPRFIVMIYSLCCLFFCSLMHSSIESIGIHTHILCDISNGCIATAHRFQCYFIELKFKNRKIKTANPWYSIAKIFYQRIGRFFFFSH